MDYDLTKIETEYPILDTLIDNCKKLLVGCILKDEEEVGKYETLDASRIGDVYVSCRNNTATYDFFNYTKAQLLEVGVYTDDDYVHYKDIPVPLRESLRKIAIRDYIANYEEPNDYYRQYCGLPPTGDEGIYITERIINVNHRNPLHKMTTGELNTLEGLGILDKYRTMYPDKVYLNFLGSSSIDPYLLRTLPNFGIIYLPQINVTEIRTRFREKLEINRVYSITCLYNEAMKYGNDYYDKFVMMFIKFQSFVDMILDVPDMIIRKDLFDLRSIKYMFESNGIEYFEEIPMKYQLAMLKNMNTLLTFKSTTKNMIDICSLFGFKNIEIFKYYILRDRKIDETTGEYKFDTTQELNAETGEYETVDDYVNNFELKFVKVPIDGILDNYIRDDKNHLTYDEMTKDDNYWNGTQDANDVYKDIVSREFNIERSKYLSIDTIYEMDKLTFEMTYFFNMIFDDVYLEENLALKIPKITDKAIKLKHAIFYLYLLSYQQSKLEDSIVFDTPTKVLSVKGFNFQVDLTKLSEYMKTHHVSLDDLGLENFTIPTEQILTFNQLIHIYLNNKKAHDHIVKQMKEADNAEIYKIYKDMYDALMITDISAKIFELPNGEIATTYTEYFMNYNTDIYNHITNIRTMSGKEQQNAVSDAIIDILCALEDYIDTSEFDFLFINMPLASEFVKRYIYKVINFYKSYRVQLDKINTIYRFNDSLENRITVIDTKHILGMFDIKTIQELSETTMFDAIMKMGQESIPFNDKILIGWALDYVDDSDIVGIFKEQYDMKVLMGEDDFSHFMFKTKMLSKVQNTIKDRYELTDYMHISITN